MLAIASQRMPNWPEDPRKMVAEAGQHLQDIVAEVVAENDLGATPWKEKPAVSPD
jgi:hypothetical protein